MAKRVLEVDIIGNAKSLQAAYAKGGSAGKKFANDSQHFHAKVSTSFGQMAKSALKAAAGIGIAYEAIAQGKKAVQTTESLASATEKLHRNFGLSIKTASTWAAVLQSNGVDASSAHMAFTTLSKSLVSLDKGSKPATAAFKDLGLSQKALQGLNFEQSLAKVTKALTDMRGGTKRAADAQVLFGRGAKLIAPMLRSDGLGFQQQAKWAREYGATLDGHAIKSSKDLKMASEQLKFAQMGLQIQFTEKIAPALLKVEGAGLRVLKIFKDPNLTSDQKWAKVSKVIDSLAVKLEHAFEQAFPRIMDAAAQEAPKAAGAFVKAWLAAGIWGKLFTIALIAKKIGLFSSLGNMAVKAFAAKFIPGMAATGAAGGEAAAGAQGLASGSVLAKFKASGGLLAKATGAVFVASLLAQIAHVKNADPLAFLHPDTAGDPRPGHGDIQPKRNYTTRIGPNGNVIRTPTSVKTPGGKKVQIPGSLNLHPPQGHKGNVARGASVPSAHAASTYSIAGLVGLAKQKGLKGMAAATAGAVAYAESSGRSDATNLNTDGSVDVGLWQINSVHGYSESDMMVPSKNADAMMAVSSGGTNWMPWVTYAKGLHKPYMAAALKAAGSKSVGKGGKAAPTPSPHFNYKTGTTQMMTGAQYKSLQASYYKAHPSGHYPTHRAQSFHMPAGGVAGIIGGSGKGQLFPLEAQIGALDKAVQKWGNNSNPAAKKFVRALNSALAKKQALKDFRDALASVKDEMSSLADEAAGKFQQSLEDAIQNGPLSTALKALQGQATANNDQSAVDQANSDLAFALKAQNPKLIADAQKALDDAQRQQKEDDLQKQIDDQEAGVQSQVDNYRAGLDSQLNALVGNLAAGKETYKQFVKDVNDILGGLGISYAGSADIEFSITGMVHGGGGGGKSPVVTGGKPQPFYKGPTKNPFYKSGFATGGVIRVGELGPEVMRVDSAGRPVVTQASDVRRGRAGGGGGGNVIVQGDLVVNNKQDAHAAAHKLAFLISRS